MLQRVNDGAMTLATISQPAVTRPGSEVVSIPVLVRWWFIILRRKFVILPILLGALALGAVATLIMEPKYEATARIEISKSKQNVAQVDDRPQQTDLLTDLTYYQTQYALLRARSIAERVARAQNLVEDAAFVGAFKLNRGGPEKPSSAIDRAAKFNQVVNILRGAVTIAPVRDSTLVDVRFRSPDPALSARIANAWVGQFTQSALDRQFAATADSRSFLETRLEQLRRRLEQSERDLVTYTTGANIVALSTSVDADGRTSAVRTLIGERLEAASQALSEATAHRVEMQSKMFARGADVASTQGSPVVSALRQRRAEVAADYAKLLVQFEPNYPPARALAQEIKSLDTAIADERTRTTRGVSRDFDQAVARERELRSIVDGLQAEINNQRRRNIQANIYQREVDTNRQLYDALLQRYKQIGVAGVGSSNVAVIDEARPPEAPSSPNLALNMLVALFLGAMVAASVTFALEQVDEGVGDPADLMSLLELPFLGAIPLLRDEAPLDSMDDSKSITSEAYFAILTSLRFSTDHGVPRSLMLTSTRAREGKSTSSMGLARILGRTGKRVALVDVDMRSPSLHGSFDLPNKVGVSNYLSGQADYKSLVRETNWENVWLISSGPQPPNAPELLTNGRIKMLIDELLEDFDHVILDMPPVLGLADSPLLSSSVEAVIFVVSANGPSGRKIRAAVDRLLQAQANVIGAMFTMFQSESSSYGYGYDFEYGRANASARNQTAIANMDAGRS
ncbi:MAG: protein tyrosine kinase [Sphingobium sp.]|nr:protein tyrosine kinase [Sphingobium sp.]